MLATCSPGSAGNLLDNALAKQNVSLSKNAAATVDRSSAEIPSANNKSAPDPGPGDNLSEIHSIGTAEANAAILASALAEKAGPDGKISNSALQAVYLSLCPLWPFCE